MHGPSHGGSSSFSGGGSFGGGSSFSSGSSTSGGYRAPRQIVFFGHTFFVPHAILTGVVSCLVVLFVCVMLVVQSANQLSDAKMQLRYMDEDEKEWQQIIETAKKDEDDNYFTYTVNIDGELEPSHGTFVDGYSYSGLEYIKQDENGKTIARIIFNYCLTRDGLDYYQVYFTFKDGNDKTITDITYAQYSENQIANINHITFAYQILENDIYAINIDYDKLKCMEYYEYKDSLASAKNLLIISSVFVTVFILVIALLIVFGVKKGKKYQELKEKKNQAEVDKLNAETENIKADTKKKNRKCAYCGGDVPEDAQFCPSCGSIVSKE